MEKEIKIKAPKFNDLKLWLEWLSHSVRHFGCEHYRIFNPRNKDIGVGMWKWLNGDTKLEIQDNFGEHGGVISFQLLYCELHIADTMVSLVAKDNSHCFISFYNFSAKHKNKVKKEGIVLTPKHLT